eukprot:gb/GECG01016694.1/.p1 GENE.gb/GECG01016694.1/~~gb/GECG01016694.1/.p1  ORF type:complete len:365 (+),score=21.49 gb/GECG01016694.1/:1-1095(+)
MISLGEQRFGDVGLSTGQIRAGQAIGAVMGFATIMGTCLLLVTYVLTSWKGWKADPWSPVELRVKALAEGYMFQIFWLSIANLGEGITFALSAAIPNHFEDMNQACKTQAYFISYFPLSSSCWSLMVAYEMHRFVQRPDKDLNGTFGRTRYFLYHIVCWLFPGISATIVAYYSSTTNAGTLCWLGEPEGRKAAYYVEYLPRAISWITILCLYASVLIELRLSRQRGHPKHVTRVFKKLYLYPLVYLLIMLFPVWHRMFSGYHSDGTNGSFTSSGIAYMFVFLSPAQGFVNAVLYVLTYTRAQELLFKCKKTEADPMDQQLLGNSLQQQLDVEIANANDAFSGEQVITEATPSNAIYADPYFALR